MELIANHKAIVVNNSIEQKFYVWKIACVRARFFFLFIFDWLFFSKWSQWFLHLFRTSVRFMRFDYKTTARLQHIRDLLIRWRLFMSINCRCKYASNCIHALSHAHISAYHHFHEILFIYSCWSWSFGRSFTLSEKFRSFLNFLCV